MSRKIVEGTQGYSAEAPDLLKRYERFVFSEAHHGDIDLIPASPIHVLDIGAGTGRDAAWFAARGDCVTAVEPTLEMRAGAIALHPEPNIEWIDDYLTELASVRGRMFDLVWMSAVWMHFDTAERAEMMPIVSRLLRPGGSLMVSLRHGPVPPGRRMFEVGAKETTVLARTCGLKIVSARDFVSAYAVGVTWSRLWFQKAKS